MVKGEGEFTFQQATGWDSECVIYFIAEINEILELQLLKANYNCEQESVDLVNGWIRNGQTIPRQTTNRSIAKEHMCSTSTTYVTSQNAAMLSVKLNTGSSFTISSVARTIDNGMFFALNRRNSKLQKNCLVCDAIIPELMPRWKSYSINEKHRACSVHIFYPVQINVPIATVVRITSNMSNTIYLQDCKNYWQFIIPKIITIFSKTSYSYTHKQNRTMSHTMLLNTTARLSPV